jgi:Tol biopolymer transport system component
VRYSETPEQNGVFMIPASGGVDRKLTPLRHLDHIFDSHLDWSPDGKSMAVVDRESDVEPFSIFLVSAETGERRRLTFPPAQSLGDTSPRFGPDGASLVFRRSLDSGVNDLYWCHVSDAPCVAKRLTFGKGCIKSHAWIARGRELIYSDPHGFWRVPSAGGTPQAILGLTGGADFIAASRQGNRLAYSVWSADMNIWRIATDAARVQGDPKPLIASTRDERSPEYAPDGNMIAFRSDRSGSSEIWLCNSQGEHPVQLTSFGGPLTGSPRWSPDGLQIVFDSRPEGNSDIYVARIASGAIRRLTYNTAADVLGSWSSDGQWIYFASNRSGRWEIWRTPSDGSARDGNAVQLTYQGGFAPLESPDGKMLYYAKGPDVGGLWAVPVAGGPERCILPQLKPGYWGYWAPGGDRIYFVDLQPHDVATVYAYNAETREMTKIAKLPKAPPYGDSGFSISPDRRWILYTQVDHSGSDIMLADLR